ncbi:T9SS type A sorting domain-containing protein [Candidatus Latescibacterota bacterium]
MTSVKTGDLNGDGFEDIIIGSMYSEANGLEFAGNIFIIFGNANFLQTNPLDLSSSQNILTITGNERYDYLGRSISTGDINGDGFDDVLFGANNILINNDPYQGNGYVLLGYSEISSRSLIYLKNPPSDVIVITGDYKIGTAASLGDINGDGFDDILLGAAASYNDTEASYIIKGSSDFENIDIIDLAVDSPDIIKIMGENSSDYFGIATASGDINGDGFDEVIIGARQASNALKQNCGKAYIIWGLSGFFTREQMDLSHSLDNITVINGADEYNYLGTHLWVGNLDNDGFDEIILESSRHDPGDRPFAGAIYIMKGFSWFSEMTEIDMGDSYPNLIKIYGKNENDMLGKCKISDINSDGVNDIILNSLGLDELGETYLLTDETLWSQNIIDLNNISSEITTIYGDQPSGVVGWDLDTGDIDGDGYNDLIMGSTDLPWASYYSEGIAFIMSGAGVGEIPFEPFQVSATETGNSSSIVIQKEHPPQLFGIPLTDGSKIGVFTPSGICAGLGEWNGEDLVITVWGDNSETPDTEGFVDSEQYYFRFLDISSNSEYDAQARIPFGDPIYHENDMVVLSSLFVGIVTKIEETDQIPFHLDKNYPNPFNPMTTIPFSLPESGMVTIEVYSILGQRVKVILDEYMSTGHHSVVFKADNLANGIYFYTIKANGFKKAKSMLLLK